MLELASELAPVRILSVTELTRYIRDLLEGQIGEIWVEGEISNYRRQSSGHQYFTLKDHRSQLQCVLFRDAGIALAAVPLADGMHVQAFGALSVYESRGQHQLVVAHVQARGLGALQARFEALKRKLNAEGLFDPARKRPLPAFPLAIGLITSPTAAALQDMLNVLRRRAPWVRVLINPVRVQGQGACVEIARAIGEFNAWALHPQTVGSQGKRVDLIVLARGGGSIEDLWEFNEEIVARAIAASALPVVSAVGHEIDFTIADFAADLRAPTPSAAAELIVPATSDLRRRLSGTGQILTRRLLDRVSEARVQLQNFSRGTLGREPKRRLQEERQRLDLADDALKRAAFSALRALRVNVDEKSSRLRVGDFHRSVELRRQLLQTSRAKVASALVSQREKWSSRLKHAENLLRVLGPEATIARGYSITTNASGEVIRSVENVRAGDTIITRLSDGVLRSTADEASALP